MLFSCPQETDLLRNINIAFNRSYAVVLYFGDTGKKVGSFHSFIHPLSVNTKKALGRSHPSLFSVLTLCATLTDRALNLAHWSAHQSFPLSHQARWSIITPIAHTQIRQRTNRSAWHLHHQGNPCDLTWPAEDFQHTNYDSNVYINWLHVNIGINSFTLCVSCN